MLKQNRVYFLYNVKVISFLRSKNRNQSFIGLEEVIMIKVKHFKHLNPDGYD